MADLGHGEAPGRALHQPHAKPLLEQRQPPAQPRTRRTEDAGGGREALMLDDLGKEIEIVEVLHGRHCLILRTVRRETDAYCLFRPDHNLLTNTAPLGRS